MDFTKYNYHGESPKPKFNTTWYCGTDKYSDGPVEDKIIDIIINNKSENYSEDIASNFSWPTYYHLINTRQNILNWYPFKKNGSVLEIGCGMGAITELLCKKCESVTAVEMSMKRAVATTLRCREYENLEIIVANLNDIKFQNKFDYITLIGVLEYQGKYTDTGTPYIDFLKKVKSLLKKDGKLLIAIENKYGLKYWCGACEDHSGIPFDGLNQYRFSNAGFRTFSKAELSSMLKKAGFKNSYFYYPLPDYKLPTRIFSEDMLPTKEDMYNFIPYYIPSDNTMCIMEKFLYDDVIENGAFEFMANSFLVECCSEDIDLGKVKKVFTATYRKELHRVLTIFTNNEVEKKGMSEDNTHIVNSVEYLEAMKNRGIKVWDCELHGNKMISSICKLPVATEIFIDAYKNKDQDRIYFLFDKLLLDIRRSSEYTEQSFLQEMGILRDSNLPEGDVILKNAYIDMIYRNAFWDEDTYIWFDQEWMLENMPSTFILYHNLMELYQSYEWMNDILQITDIFKHYGIDNIISEYKFIWSNFLDIVIDKDQNACNQAICGYDVGKIVKNVKKLLE